MLYAGLKLLYVIGDNCLPTMVTLLSIVNSVHLNSKMNSFQILVDSFLLLHVATGIYVYIYSSAMGVYKGVQDLGSFAAKR